MSEQPTVNDIGDDNLLRRVVRSGRRVKTGGEPRWVRITRLFGLGSTFAHQLCRRYEVDPDERVALR